MNVFVFDMNGTLLDTGALDPLFERAFGKAERRQQWFSQAIELAMASAVTGYYVEFPKLAEAALQMTEDRYGASVPEDLRQEILAKTKTLPAYPDVVPGLDRLKKAGVRLAVLTNSPLMGAEHSLRTAGLHSYFDKVMSAEAVQRFKPSAVVYRTAAQQLGITITQMTMVAAHSWDTTGATRAGCEAAFIHRPGEPLDVIAPKPRYIAREFVDLAEQVLAK
jgi:2-haloacid dehalogenase